MVGSTSRKCCHWTRKDTLIQWNSSSSRLNNHITWENFFIFSPRGRLAGVKSNDSDLVSQSFPPQIEQLQTSLQAASDERIRLEEDLQHNREMVRGSKFESQCSSCNLDVSVLILDEPLRVAGRRDSKPWTQPSAAAPGEGEKTC